MEKETNVRDNLLVFDDLVISRDDLLRALSWSSLIPAGSLNEKDKKSIENLFKLINYLTRNG